MQKTDNKNDSNNSEKAEKGLGSLVIKPNINAVFFFSVLNIIFVLILIFGISKLIVYFVGENPLNSLIEILSISGIVKGGEGLISLINNVLIFIIIISCSTYLLLSIIRVNNLCLELEEFSLNYTFGILVKKNERISYDNIIKVKYKEFVFGLGKIIIERYNVDKTIEMPFVSSVRENFEILRQSIKEGLKRELKEEIKKTSEGKLPEYNVNEIIEMLTKENTDANEVLNTFKNISKTQPITKETKNVFKLVLLELIKRRIISREIMREVLRALREQNFISKEDIVDIVELRFAIEESIY
ncbi:MAG: hypothetical protein ACP5OZ_01525 [Candidatus Woesearchaeota archaeon]